MNLLSRKSAPVFEEGQAAPSILSADFSRLRKQLAEVTRAGADYIHIDIMDRLFVPDITIGVPVVAALRYWTELLLDVHLMIERLKQDIERLVQAGADIITVQAEDYPHLHPVVQRIAELNVKPGVGLNSGTPLAMVEEVLPLLDLVLIL